MLGALTVKCSSEYRFHTSTHGPRPEIGRLIWLRGLDCRTFEGNRLGLQLTILGVGRKNLTLPAVNNLVFSMTKQKNKKKTKESTYTLVMSIRCVRSIPDDGSIGTEIDCICVVIWFY